MLGHELRKAREKAGLTQDELSVRAKLDRSYISLLENDHKSPTVDVLFRICDALATTPSHILARIERRRSSG